VDKEPKATRSGNARIHGMTQVTAPSIAYVAMQVRWGIKFDQNHLNCSQVRFALTSSTVFSRTDTTTDSETFYTSLLELLEDEDEKDEVKDLLTWWNRCADFFFFSFFFWRMLCDHSSRMQANIPQLHGIAAPCDEGQRVVEDQGEASAAAGQIGQFIRQHHR
jgi:hypothetical protein